MGILERVERGQVTTTDRIQGATAMALRSIALNRRGVAWRLQL